MIKGDARSFSKRPKGLPSILTELRLEAGLTLDQLARTSGISRCMLGEYERGERSPKVCVLENILLIFNYEIEILRINDKG